MIKPKHREEDQGWLTGFAIAEEIWNATFGVNSGTGLPRVLRRSNVDRPPSEIDFVSKALGYFCDPTERI